jgi:hypothetical protein
LTNYILTECEPAQMLNEAASRSRSAAHVGGVNPVGGIIAAYDNTTTSEIHPRSCEILPFVAAQNALSNVTADMSLSLHAIITVRRN